MLNVTASEGLESRCFNLAAVLTRVVARKVEMEAFEYLQQQLHHVLSKNTEWPMANILPRMQMLGRFLVSLRRKWRGSVTSSSAATLSHAGMFQSGPSGLGGLEALEPEERLQPEQRLKKVCEILFFYFCAFRRQRLPQDLDEGAERLVRGVSSGDGNEGENFPEAFPTLDEEDPEGFENWMTGAGLGNFTSA